MAVVPIRKTAAEFPRSKAVEANQKAVDALPYNSGAWRVEGTPGLYVRCQAKTKTFRIERRVDGDLVKKTLAAVTVKQAKAAAAKMWPSMKPTQAPAGILTLGLAIEQFLQGKVPQPAAKTQELARYNADRYLAHWKDRSLEEMGRDRAGIRTLQQHLTKKHGQSTSNQVIRLLAAVYRWHQDTNPDWPDWPRKAAAIHKIAARDWAYSSEELLKWWSVTVEKDGKKVALGVKTLNPLKRMWWILTLLTGARKGSVEALRWADVDLEKKLIRFQVTKGDRPYVVPMSDLLASLLTTYRDSGEVPPSVWLFPSPVIEGAHLGDVKDTRSGVGPAHRLRHLFRTTLAQMGVAGDQARLLLGHSMGGDVSRGYVTASLVVESLRPITNAVAARYLEILGSLGENMSPEEYGREWEEEEERGTHKMIEEAFERLSKENKQAAIHIKLEVIERLLRVWPVDHPRRSEAEADRARLLRELMAIGPLPELEASEVVVEPSQQTTILARKARPMDRALSADPFLTPEQRKAVNELAKAELKCMTISQLAAKIPVTDSALYSWIRDRGVGLAKGRSAKVVRIEDFFRRYTSDRV